MRTEHMIQSGIVTACYTIINIIMKIVLFCKTEQLTSASSNLFVAQFIEDTVNMGHRCDTHISNSQKTARTEQHTYDIHSQPKLSF